MGVGLLQAESKTIKNSMIGVIFLIAVLPFSKTGLLIINTTPSPNNNQSVSYILDTAQNLIDIPYRNGIIVCLCYLDYKFDFEDKIFLQILIFQV